MKAKIASIVSKFTSKDTSYEDLSELVAFGNDQGEIPYFPPEETVEISEGTMSSCMKFVANRSAEQLASRQELEELRQALGAGAETLEVCLYEQDIITSEIPTPPEFRLK